MNTLKKALLYIVLATVVSLISSSCSRNTIALQKQAERSEMLAMQVLPENASKDEATDLEMSNSIAPDEAIIAIGLPGAPEANIIAQSTPLARNTGGRIVQKGAQIKADLQKAIPLPKLKIRASSKADPVGKGLNAMGVIFALAAVTCFGIAAFGGLSSVGLYLLILAGVVLGATAMFMFMAGIGYEQETR